MSDESLKSYRQESRIDYGTCSDNLTLEQLKAGAILRMADSLELIAKSKEELEKELMLEKINTDYWEDEADYWIEESKMISRSNSALRGHLTRLKRKNEALKAELAQLKKELSHE